MPIITLEEHFITPDLQRAIAKVMPPSPSMAPLQAKLIDLGPGRLAAMDAGSVDMQVLSVAALGLDLLDSDTATDLMHDANDELAAAVTANPTRYAGFANVNLLDPTGAAKEFARCMQTLKFKGALVNGHTGGAFLDDPRFLPIWEAAEALSAPIYLHPAPPPKAVYETYYTGLPGELGHMLSIAGWGWHVELGLHCLRLILSGLFDRFPDQQVIIGHMGEDLPFSLARADSVLGRGAKHLKRSIPEYFHQNFHVTTSGYFTLPPFQCALDVVGIDRLLYSVDYPLSDNTTGKDFLDSLSISPEDRAKLTHQNAMNLLDLSL
jgi:predicted TIM-barrel fold metal-dependent hydrolase